MMLFDKSIVIQLIAFDFWFFLWEECELYQTWEIEIILWIRVCLIKQEVFSIHTDKSSMPNKWVDLLPYPWTLETTTLQNSCMEDNIPYMIGATEIGARASSTSALKIVNESPSITNWILISLANWSPASKAIVSMSMAPNGALIFLLNVAFTKPWASRIIKL